MFAVMGITGNVGGEVARNLLAAGRAVRGVVRDAAKAGAWTERGCTLATADINHATSMAAAFRDAEGVFVLVPPSFDPSPDFSEARTTAGALSAALADAKPRNVVYLSTIGAQSTRSNLLTQHTIIEQALRALPLPITFLRPGWFIENASWDVAPATKTGVIASFLQPLDKRVPMVSTADIGRVAAELLQEPAGSGEHRVAELEGPRRVSPHDIADAFAQILGRDVRAEAVPRETWATLFVSQGMKNPTPRIQMLDGFNEGWIEFERGEAGSRKGNVTLESALRALAERGNAT